MKPYLWFPIVFSVLLGCYASQSPPKEMISLKEQQEASNKEIDRLRKEVITLSGLVENLRRRLKIIEATTIGQNKQKALYEKPLEEKIYNNTTKYNDSSTNMIQRSLSEEQDKQINENLPEQNLEPDNNVYKRKRIVLKLRGTPQKTAHSISHPSRIKKFIPIKEPQNVQQFGVVTEKDPIDLYQKAMGLFRTGQYIKASKMFERLWRAYPHHNLADNALFWRGECFYRLRKYQKALNMYEKVMDLYPQGNKFTDAMLKSSLALSKIGKKQKAINRLNHLIRDYPGTESSFKAKTILERNLL